MDNTQLQHLKAKCLTELRKYQGIPELRKQLDAIDARLWLYIEEATDPLLDEFLPSAEGGKVHDSIASLYELLCIRKAFRKMMTYQLDVEYAQRWLRSIEGEWNEGIHQKGGVRFDTPRGPKHVRLMPFQAWFVVTTMLYHHDVSLERDHEEGEELMATEYVKEGRVFDRRRLCTEADLFITRKAGKTELGAAMDFAQFAIMGESNEQVSIVANDANQAIKIAYRAIKTYAYQIDPSSTNKLGGKVFKVGASSMQFREGLPRTASVTAFAAGGKPRDGFNSGWVHNDEAGQGKYVNDHNDMESTVQELVGSGGVRRERLRLNTTTAGKVVTGPYKEHIERLEENLLCEMDIPLGIAKALPYDNNNALLLRLDPWDYDGSVDSLDHAHLFKRVNRAIGTTVQPTWYKERIMKAKTGTEDDRKEVLTKDFNIWQSEKVQKWIQADEIRKLQTDMTIEDCKADEGWLVFCGLDFTNIGDDLQAQSYLAARINPLTGKKEYFADLDAWVPQDMAERSPIRNLLQHYADCGYLHIVPGKVLSPNMPLDRCVSLRNEHRVNIMGWGYDPARADEPINLIKDYLVTLGIHPQNLGNHVMPVSQKYFVTTGLIDAITYLIRSEYPQIHFSSNPMWSWEFQNCMIIESSDGMENKKIVKSGQDNKVDNVQALLNALQVFNTINSKVIK